MIRYRLALPDDIATCVQFIADHPVLGPRYGHAIDNLGAVWHRFLNSDALLSIVSEEIRPGTANTLIGSFIAGLISDEFAMQLTTPPLKWIGPELINRCIHGPVPILTDAEVRHANSTRGINVLVWPTASRADFENHPELIQGGQVLFFDAYRGFNIQRLQVQASHPAEMAVAVNSGAWRLREGDAVHSRTLEQPTEAAVLQPHMLEATREMAEQQPGSWVSLLLAYRKPVIGFTRSEQRLLSAALQGETDAELSDRLDISLSAVKKLWASIYLRVQSRESLGVRIKLNESADRDRGKQKKHKLLAYLRKHPEELKPYSLRLLENGL
jgi:DNA-binding CsgD family transcriptional regulator